MFMKALYAQHHGGLQPVWVVSVTSFQEENIDVEAL